MSLESYVITKQEQGLQVLEWLRGELVYLRHEAGISLKSIPNRKCRIVNLAMVAHLNQFYPDVCAIGLRAPNTRNQIFYEGIKLEHVVGYCFNTELNLHFVFDGTADQILGVGNGIQICHASTFKDSVQRMNNVLGINITQQIIGPQSYSPLY
jgi:hypothetical protein